MSEAEERRKRIDQRIADSQDRMRRDSVHLPAAPKRENLPDAYPPEDYRALAREYPWLTVAAGAGLGLLAGALLPKRMSKGAGKGFGKRALGIAAMAAELGLALSRQAGEAASERSAPLRQSAGRAASTARSGARSAGSRIAREAIRLAARARK